MNRLDSRRTVVVVGSNEVGSAIARTLHALEMHVVLIDDADPPWPRRGMSFVDAWYVGGATLDGVDACFCSSVRSVSAVLARDTIAATTWSWQGVVASIDPMAVIDARADETRSQSGRPAVVQDTLLIGVHQLHVCGVPADIAIAHVGDSRKRVVQMNGGGWHRVDDGLCVMSAPHAGRFRTRCEIGERVEASDVLGEIGACVARAPMSGVLRGASARGARVAMGQIVLEIDPSNDVARCFGIEPRIRDLAARVGALVRRKGLAGSSLKIGHRAQGCEQLLATPDRP